VAANSGVVANSYLFEEAQGVAQDTMIGFRCDSIKTFSS
jgi:hypothetical protein